MRKWIKPALIVILFLGLVISYYLLNRNVIVGKLECSSQYGACPEELTKSLTNLEGLSIHESKSSVKDIFAKNKSVHKYSLSFIPPNKLKATVIIRKAQYALYDKDMNLYLIDKFGVVLGQTSNSVFTPLKTNKEKFLPGDNLEPTLLFALRLLKGVGQMGQVNDAYLEDDMMVLSFVDGPKLILPPEGDQELILGSIRFMMDQSTKYSQNSRIEKDLKQVTLDLRFKNPVIK